MRHLKIFLPLCLFAFSFMQLFSMPDSGMMAIEQAAKEDKHLFVFFYKEQNERTKRMERVFDEFQTSSGEKARFIKINSTIPNAKPMLEKFNLNRSPMPFVLVLAPNGAVTGAYTASFTEQELADSFSSQGMASCLKALQDNKLVFLCFQNQNTAGNEAALKGVSDFKADSRFGATTEMVLIDPLNIEERKFLNQLSVEPQLTQAATILIAPPAETIGRYHGATYKEQFISDLQKAVSGCCGSGGCCPGGC
ncbi:MAG: hypothetical protein ACHQUC_04915 [Chlamydiales bacterium]